MFFEFSCYVFWNFLAEGEYERNSGLKFFSPFLGLSHPVLAKKKKMPERGFLNFFAIFVGIFLPGSNVSGIRGENFFLPFSAYLIPFWLEIFPEIGFLIS